MAPRERRGRDEAWADVLAQPPLPDGVEERVLTTEPFSFIRSVQQIALAGVLAPDQDAWYRRVFRWYAKTFATPLHVVDTLPLYDVLVAYYEDRYEQLDEKEREAVRVVLAETEAERRLRLEAKAEEGQIEEDLIAQLEAEETARLAAMTAEQQRAQVPELPSISQDFGRMGGGLLSRDLTVD